MSALLQTLEEYGASPSGIRLFDDDVPELLPYATLVSARRFRGTADGSDLAALQGVYEWQDSPLVFLINGDELSDDAHFQRIRRRVAFRGDAPYLGVVRPGQLTVYSVSLDQRSRDQSRIHLAADPSDRPTTFARLANERPRAASHSREWISNVVLDLLRGSIRDLLGSGARHDDAVSLAGRALFTRFLADRYLLADSLMARGGIDATELFDDPARAEETSRWLDDTFNGDFLPLTARVFGELRPEAFHTLGNILRRAVGGQMYLGWERRWGDLDFAHIPVGVLSQAYEQFMREHDPARQRKEGAYYTPRAIAELMVRGAFHALRREGPAHVARVLDPAAGAGVFLVAAFRQLVEERWRNDGARPDTRVLRQILYHQLTGFDTNEGALRFAALALYLMSIELDPHPEPVEKLRFEDLRGRVLRKMAEDVTTEAASGRPVGLGSLGPAVGSEHIGRYDLVLGNPPWTTSTRLPGWAEVKQTVARIARGRLPEGTPAPPLPNEALDQPFIWRAMEWARPGGQIALALHARLLFQQGDGMPDARRAIFDAVDVTGVLNGAELRQTKVWPEVSAPFCLLFATNHRPPPGAAFRFVSPRLENLLNGASALRVDASNAEMVTPQQVKERPEILKILFRGNRLDLEVFERMTSKTLKTLEGYWAMHFGAFRGRTGNGYQKLRPSSRVRKGSTDGLPGASASYLARLLELTPAAMQTPLVDPTKLDKFTLDRIHDPRPLSLFQAPLLIVHQSPSALAGRLRVAVSDDDLVFNETYYGYSAEGHPDARQLVRYLALLLGSKPALWYVLMVSGKFGFERDVVEKITVDSLPAVSFEELTPSDRAQIDPLFEAVVNAEQNWHRVDVWAASLFGLRERDLQVIGDTLAFNLPFASNRAAAQERPSREEVSAFCEALAEELGPWAMRAGTHIDVRSLDLPTTSPWEVLHLRVGRAETATAPSSFSDDWMGVLRIADELGTSEVLMPGEMAGGLWIGRLRQARYWSRSQARLVARRIVWEHSGSLFGREGK